MRFVAESHVDSLAVAIGTAHGFYHGDPKLNFELLKTLRARLTLPLVLHGASGLSDEDVRTAVTLGVSKINFATELRCAYTDAVREALKDTAIYDPKKYGKPGRESVKRRVIEKMTLCGCIGKA